jgi:hypothetical protein
VSGGGNEPRIEFESRGSSGSGELYFSIEDTAGFHLSEKI